MNKLWRYVMLAGVLFLGVWLLSNLGSLAPESVSQQNAVQALAPAGAVSDVSEDSAGNVGGAVSPVVVNLADIPAGELDPNNQFDRWQRGEIDLDEIEGMRSAAELAAMREASLDLPASRNVDIATSGPGLLSPSSGVSFDSIDYNECCGGGGSVPPDPELAAGPNHVIAVVNVAFEIYNTNGNSVVGPTTFSSFMSADSNCTGVFDPNVLYDESTDRYMLAIDADGTHYCIAVSQTGDPTGSWNLYSFDTSPNRRDFFDYPHAGVGNDAIYMGGNIFRGNRFQEARIWAFDKAAMYAGSSASFVTRSLGGSEDTPQPLNLHGWNDGSWPTSGPHYFITETNYNGRDYSIFSWDDPFGANNFATVNTVDLQAATGVAAGLPVDVPQSGSSQTLQANDYRPQDFEFRNGYGWTVSTIACNPGGGTVDCVRWAQIDLATGTVADAGVYASNGEYRTFGDLAVNACDDMAVGYTKSSTSMFPSIWYTGRQSGDPAGTLQAESQLKAGEIAYDAFDSNPHRWGDYTEMTIAPDGVTFWYLGEYSKNTGNPDGRWGTYIGSFSYACDPGDPDPTPTPGPTATPTATPSPASNMHVGDLDASSSNSNGNRWNAHVTITVHDDSENPVANATVSGSWSNGANGSGSCVTDGAGQCTITRNNVKGNRSSVTFTVTNVTHASNSYDAGDNHDPDGDSNGSTINVNRP